MQIIQKNGRHDPNTANKITIACDQNIYSQYTDGCEIYCSATSVCGSTISNAAPTILCPHAKCIIHCDGIQSCENLDIKMNMTVSSPLYHPNIVLLCSGAESCRNATIYAPKQSNISVVCDNSPFGNFECHSLTIHGKSADIVHITCNGAYCNAMDIYCPSGHCIIECNSKFSSKCDANNIYIESNNLNTNELGLVYECSTKKEECIDSYIHCDFSDGLYHQKCEWMKFSVNDEIQWNCHEEDSCHGLINIGFLTSFESPSTIVFVAFMGFGFLVVLIIAIYNMKEKYNEWQSTKKAHRKRSKIKQQSRRSSQKKAILIQGHKLHGSYYKPPAHKKRANKKTQRTNSESEMDSQSESQFDGVYVPKSIDIIEEDDGEYGIINEEEEDPVLQTPNKKKGRKNAPNIEMIRSYSDSTRKKTDKSTNRKKKKKKRKEVHMDTPVASEHKYDQDPDPLLFHPLNEAKSDDEDHRQQVKIQIKTKKKKKAKKKPAKKSKQRYRDDGYRSHSEESATSVFSTRSTKSTKGKKKQRVPKLPRMQVSQSYDGNPSRKKKVTRKKVKSAKKIKNKSKDKDKVPNTTISKSKSAPNHKLNKAKKKPTKAKSVKLKNPKKRKQSTPIKKTSAKKNRIKKANSVASFSSMKKKNESDDDESIASSMFGFFTPKSDKKAVRPTLQRVKSSPMESKQKKSNVTSQFMWYSFYASQVYGVALFHAWDIAADLGVIVNWIENDEPFVLIILSSSVVFFYRFVSAIALWRQFGWQWGIIQFFDLTIYIECYRSLQNKYCAYTREMKWIRRMEALFESTPQALLQLGYLLKSPEFTTNYKNNDFELFDILIILSFLSSLLSIAFSVARDDEAHVELHAMPFFVPYFRDKKKRAKHYEQVAQEKKIKSPKNKKTNYVKERKAEEKRKKKVEESMLATHELENCYLKADEYEPDAQNTIWLPNWKYLVRFSFRFTEATARILTLTLFWVAFGGPYVSGLIILSVIFYVSLQLGGIIGYEWGNMFSFVVVHPNLTLKTEYKHEDPHPLVSVVAYHLSGWSILNGVFKFDMVETHFVHRFLETLAHLTIITIAIYVYHCCGVIEEDDLGNTYNTKEVFDSSFGYIVVGTASVCAVLTPFLYRFIVSDWVKKGSSLENNLFGLIKSFDKTEVIRFLQKSKRSEQLVNSVSNGYTPLALACDIQFFDILEVLVSFGANIDEQNKRGETPLFIFAQQKTLTKYTKQGLQKLKKLGADFSVVDKNGFSVAFRAAEEGNTKFLLWLFQNEMSQALEAKDFSDKNIAHMAAYHDNDKLLQKVVKYRKNGVIKTNLLLEKDDEGRIPLHYGFQNQSPNACMYLIELNRDTLKIEDESGDTPLNYGARYGDVSFFKELKRLGYKKFRDFLIPVAIEGEVDTLKWLLRECQGTYGKRKPLEKFVDKKSDRSPLHYACMHGNDKLLPPLVKYKFDINETDHKHRTPAFFAAERGHLNCLKALEKLDASFKIQNNRRLTPYDIAEQNENRKCVAFLYHHPH